MLTFLKYMDDQSMDGKWEKKAMMHQMDPLPYETKTIKSAKNKDG